MSDTRPADDATLAFRSHDHAHCASDALQAAETLVAERGLRMTPVRRRTLELLLEAHRAMGAYEVLQRLTADGFGSQPPVAYRALDFLVEQGFVHRVRRLNAFMACLHPGHAHAPAFFICRTCNAVAEAPGDLIRSAMDDAATAIGFRIERANAEALGLCPHCTEAAA
jgi:Fur family zinc uptake transcriptional regulator